jgi:hypothetical protein
VATINCQARDGDGKNHRCLKLAFESGDCTIHTNEAGKQLGPCHCLDTLGTVPMAKQFSMRPERSDFRPRLLYLDDDVRQYMDLKQACASLDQATEEAAGTIGKLATALGNVLPVIVATEPFANKGDGWKKPGGLKTLAERQAELDLPSGWRWLEIGEMTAADDLLCDRRRNGGAGVRQIAGGLTISETWHPVRRRIGASAPHTTSIRHTPARPTRPAIGAAAPRKFRFED